MINPDATSIDDLFLSGDGICALCGNAHVIVTNDPVDRDPDTEPCPLCIQEGRLSGAGEHLYNDHTLVQLRELSKVIEFADQIQISGRADKVTALLTCATAVPDLLARIEYLERKNG